MSFDPGGIARARAELADLQSAALPLNDALAQEIEAYLSELESMT